MIEVLFNIAIEITTEQNYSILSKVIGIYVNNYPVICIYLNNCQVSGIYVNNHQVTSIY